MPNIEIITEPVSSRVIVSGIHFPLTPALRQAVIDKVAHLLEHDSGVVRIRVDLEVDPTREPQEQHIAKGRLEIRGPDLIASAVSENAYKSLDLLVNKLTELQRRRHQKRVNTRNDERRQVASTADDASA